MLPAMDRPILKLHWIHTLDTAAEAVEAAARAKTLTAAECSNARREITAERVWVAKVL
jgi:hypothetical protein